MPEVLPKHRVTRLSRWRGPADCRHCRSSVRFCSQARSPFVGSRCADADLVADICIIEDRRCATSDVDWLGLEHRGEGAWSFELTGPLSRFDGKFYGGTGIAVT